MATPIFLTPGDAKILAKLIEREKAVPTTTAPRTPLDMQWTEGMDPASAHTYIAVPQDAVPGSTTEKIFFGTCDVYYIDEEDQQMVPTGIEIIVYNPSPNSLPVEAIGITRDKFGKWIPLGGGGDAGVWAVVVDRTALIRGAAEVYGRYRCHEIQWIEGGEWREKPDGRIFVNCYEASTRSNANFELTGKNIVHLYRANPIAIASGSVASLTQGLEESSALPSSSGLETFVHDMMVFDKAFGVIKNPERV